VITKICGIYKILNIITKDYYLGSACNICIRWGQHRRELRKNLRGNTHFQNAWNRYGEQAFEFSIILLCDREHKLYFEDGFLKLFNPAYNIATDASAPMQGRNHSEETRARMSVARLGTHPTDETRAKMSVSSKGNTSCLGHKQTEETRAQISRTKKGTVMSDEACANMSTAKMGNTHCIGYKHTAKSRAKQSETMKKRWAFKREAQTA